MKRTSGGALPGLVAAVLMCAAPAVAQAPVSLDGEWQGQSSGNRVRIEMRAGGFNGYPVTQNAGQAVTPMFFQQVSAGEYHLIFPDGSRAIARLEGSGLRVTNPDGWSDLFVRTSPPPVQAYAPPPPPPPPPARVYHGADSAEAQALLTRLLGPDGVAAAAGMSARPGVDLAAVKAGGPGTAISRRAYEEGQRAWGAARTRRLHNVLNDATACLRVQPTGVISEWGTEGHYRLYNTCSYPVEASWCANAKECAGGGGNLWKIRAGSYWPVFFADPQKPVIMVGACRTDEAKRPPPSDADIARQGGVSEAREAPQPAPGVSLLPSHRCD